MSLQHTIDPVRNRVTIEVSGPVGGATLLAFRERL